MIFVQIFNVVLGVLMIVFSVWEYFFYPKSAFFILKRIIEYLDENERIKYQKASAVPGIILGIVIIILSVFFFDNDIASKIWWVAYIIWIACSMIINKIYLGYFFVWSVPKKIF